MDDWTSLSHAKRKAFTLQLLQYFGRNCCICGLPIKPGEESCQHLVPRSKGGLTNLDNCRPAHRRCNYQAQDKETKSLEEMIHKGLSWFF
ncbi:hypothetical protein HHJ78_04430 [Mobiluncus mulieris]|uniref:HNH nuclease domain-containing protein n=1 Tax=Mobiluncus mulieris TaxID=2052 RepID=A0A7Y0U0Q3_9ACTO|nr:hypothetical protein [Mobiluncus mulieris]